MWLIFTGWYLKIKISDKIWNNHPLFCLSKKPSPSPLMMNGSISTVKTNHRSEARCGRGWLHWLQCTGLIFLPLQCTSSVERHSAVHIVVHNCTIAGTMVWMKLIWNWKPRWTQHHRTNWAIHELIDKTTLAHHYQQQEEHKHYHHHHHHRHDHSNPNHDHHHENYLHDSILNTQIGGSVAMMAMMMIFLRAGGEFANSSPVITFTASPASRHLPTQAMQGNVLSTEYN